MFYYFAGVAKLKDRGTPVAVSVPSGNFGNLTAGVMAKHLGLPVAQFIAATNVNDVVPEYLRSGSFRPRPSQPTLSSAMRSEEHTSELQSLAYLVCRLLLEKKKIQ